MPKSSNVIKYESQNFIQQKLIERIKKVIINEIKRVKPKTLLDVGCGEGFIAAAIQKRFPKLEITGVDNSPEAVRAFKRRCPKARGIICGADKLPFDSQAFDLVLVSEVLEHLEKPELVIKEIARVAHGSIIFTVPWEPAFQLSNLARGKYLKRFGNHPEHIQRWRKTKFGQLIEKYLNIEQHRIIFPWQMVVAVKKTRGKAKDESIKKREGAIKWWRRVIKLFFRVDKRALGIFVFLMAVAGFFLFYNLGASSLRDWDEAIHASVTRNIIQNGDWLDLKYEGADYFRKPPLRFWIGAITNKIEGISELTARLPSAIFSFILLGMLFGVVRKISKDNLAALLASLMLLFSPIYLFNHASRSGEADIILTFWMLLALFCFWLARHKPYYLYLGAAALGLAFMTKPVIALLPLLSGAIYFYISGEWQKFKLKNLLISLIIFLAIVLPWHILMIVRFPGFWDTYWGYHIFKRATEVVGEHYGGPQFYLASLLKLYAFPWLILVAFALGGWWGMKDGETKRFLGYVGLYTMLGLIIISIVKSKLYWYILPMMPGLAILAAYGVKIFLDNLKNDLWVLVGLVLFEIIFFFGGATGMTILILGALTLINLEAIKQRGLTDWGKGVVVALMIWQSFFYAYHLIGIANVYDEATIAKQYGIRLKGNTLIPAEIYTLPSQVYYFEPLKLTKVVKTDTIICRFAIVPKGVKVKEPIKIIYEGNELAILDFNNQATGCHSEQ